MIRRKTMYMISLLFVVLFYSGCSYEVKSYSVLCYEKQQIRGMSLGPSYYMVYPEMQIVVQRSGGPYKFERCSIYDEDNWSCRYNDGSGEVRVSNGRKPFYEQSSFTEDPTAPYILNVHWITYWFLEIKSLADPHSYNKYCKSHYETAKEVIETRKRIDKLVDE